MTRPVVASLSALATCVVVCAAGELLKFRYPDGYEVAAVVAGAVALCAFMALFALQAPEGERR